MGYSHVSKEGMTLTGPFKTKEDAIKFDNNYAGYYSDCQIKQIEASKIYLFDKFIQV